MNWSVLLRTLTLYAVLTAFGAWLVIEVGTPWWIPVAAVGVLLSAAAAATTEEDG